MLQGFDAILLVLDHHGKILHYKAGDGSQLNAHFTAPPPVKFQDLVPREVGRRYENAVQERHNGGKLALFGYMLDLLSGAVWCESYLMRFTEDQNMMVVWNITKRRRPFVEEPAPEQDSPIREWLRALDLCGHESKDHAHRVTEMTLRLACQVGVPEADLSLIRRGAILHDIGKVAIPDSILFKPAPLTEEEWGIMRRHPVIATEILKPIPNFEPSLPIPRSHHEKWDGSGYPDGLAGEDIPLAARIFALADVYDALTSDRPYRRAWRQRDALDYIREQSGAHFDPSLAPVFIGMFRK
jgi:HD-GYP domain-containing protein (c-di-GMP phosphodiesterase class II)